MCIVWVSENSYGITKSEVYMDGVVSSSIIALKRFTFIQSSFTDKQSKLKLLCKCPKCKLAQPIYITVRSEGLFLEWEDWLKFSYRTIKDYKFILSIAWCIYIVISSLIVLVPLCWYDILCTLICISYNGTIACNDESV